MSRAKFVVALWAFGILNLLVLNGQVFTQGVTFLGAVGIATVACALGLRVKDSSPAQRRLWAICLVMGMGSMILTAIELPQRAEFQRRVNDMGKRRSDEPEKHPEQVIESPATTDAAAVQTDSPTKSTTD